MTAAMVVDFDEFMLMFSNLYNKFKSSDFGSRP